MNPRIQELFDIIKKANDELNEIRKTCSHPNYYKGLWSWRVGCINVTKICSECNDFIEYVDDDIEKYIMKKET